MSTLTLDIDRALWMTANRPIANHGMKARIVRTLHAFVQGQARVQWGDAALDPDVRRIASWLVHYPHGVRTDKGEASNAAPTCKAILDGLVPTWLPDDGPKYIVEERYRRGANLDVGYWHRITLELIEVSAP